MQCVHVCACVRACVSTSLTNGLCTWTLCVCLSHSTWDSSRNSKQMIHQLSTGTVPPQRGRGCQGNQWTCYMQHNVKIMKYLIIVRINHVFMLWEWGMVCQALSVTSDVCKKLLISAVFVSSLNTLQLIFLEVKKLVKNASNRHWVHWGQSSNGTEIDRVTYMWPTS